MKKLIVKLGLLVASSLIFISCGNTKKGWTGKEKEDFVKGCIGANRGRLDDEQAKEVCDCVLNKMIEKYPTMIDSQSMNIEDIKKNAVACWAEISDE